MLQSLWRGSGRFAALVAVALTLVVAPIPILPMPVAAQEVAEADANLRVIHASPGAPEVDVLVDGQPLIEGLAYGTTSEYMAISPEEHRIQVVPTGQTADAAVIDEELGAAPGAAYILAVYGRLNEIAGDIYEVDLSDIEPGNARVRLLNLSPDAGEIDLLETGGDEWFGNVAAGEVTDYRDVVPGTYSADLRGEDDRVLQTVSDLTIEETRAYALVVIGQVADESLELQTLITTVSPPCAEVLGIDGAGSDACVRLVHAAPDAPPVDIYINDAQIAQNLVFSSATEYVAVPSGGGRGVRVAATGTPIEEAIIDAGLDFDPGQAYEILVTGAGDDLELMTTGTDLRPVSAGQARIRVVHASPDAGVIDVGVEGAEENLFEGADFRNATEYLIIDAGEYPIEVRPGGEDMTVALQSDATFDEGVTYDLIALGRPDDQSLTLLALMAPVAILTGDVATPDAATTDESSIAETVVPEAIEDVETSPTPVP